MKRVDKCEPDLPGMPDEFPSGRFDGIRAYLAALGAHASCDMPQDLMCMLIVAQSIAGIAPALGLPETGKRALALQLFVRGIVNRNGIVTEAEREVLSRAYTRLTAAAREEGAY